MYYMITAVLTDNGHCPSGQPAWDVCSCKQGPRSFLGTCAVHVLVWTDFDNELPRIDDPEFEHCTEKALLLQIWRAATQHFNCAAVRLMQTALVVVVVQTPGVGDDAKSSAQGAAGDAARKVCSSWLP